MTKSTFISKRTNPYAIMNNSTDLTKKSNKPPEQELKPPQKTEPAKEKPLTTIPLVNPFQAHESHSSENMNKSMTSVSFSDTSTSSTINQSALFVTANKTETENLS